eukprot:m.53894 g.53894  ORF g.53894 m.53894 type:complete len:437 (-) comp7691_c1_seq1:49-1359(-)
MTLRRTKTQKASHLSVEVEQGNFWDVGNYKDVLKRISNVPKLCDEFLRMFHERAIVEKHYAKELTSFAERWEERLTTKVPEYGTLLDGWMGVTAEARQLSEVHMHCKDKVDDIMKERIESWKREHCKKGMFHLKSYKRANTAFSKAQDPWNKRKAKIDKYRANILKNDKEELQIRANATNVPTDKAKAMLDKVRTEKRKTEEKLRQRIDDLLKYKETYRREMEVEFEHCQEEERVRIEFFKETLRLYQKISIVSGEIENSHAILIARLERVNADADLQKFAVCAGVNMPMIIPDSNGVWFEEGNPPPSEGGTAYTPAPVKRTMSNPMDTSTSNADPPAYQPDTQPQQQDANFLSVQTSNANSGSDWSLNSDTAPIRSGSVVRALYAYTGTQVDELSFGEGDTITVSEAEDSDGWLKGTNNSTGASGKFPGNYVVAS